MQTETRTLLTIVTEATLEPTLLRTLTREGLRGYTITDARGRGDHGERNASWSEIGNIRLEAICTREQAERLMEHIKIRYYPDYAMIAFLQTVEIVRPEKF
ncbi:P-II family nitrogen regulator [Aeromonas enteropelogenes]|uniref:P-II family nitrogen regulator n=1 Tax=Aeromonas enteropelogenes TaxID=29489 RepID=UPI003BA2F3FF